MSFRESPKAPWILFPVVYFATFWLPELLKLAVTGSSGPTTAFFGRLVLAPMAFLFLGAYFGRRSLFVHFAMIVFGALYLYVSFPPSPLLDMKRELVARSGEPVALIFVVGLMFRYLVIKPRSRRRAVETQELF